MSSSSPNQPALLSIAPRFVVRDLPQALAFYEQLGFQATLQDDDFAIVERDAVALHLNRSPDAPTAHRSVCWIGVAGIEALYQQFSPTQAVSSHLTAQPWGFKVFMVRDPSGNGLLFGEPAGVNAGEG